MSGARSDSGRASPLDFLSAGRPSDDALAPQRAMRSGGKRGTTALDSADRSRVVEATLADRVVWRGPKDSESSRSCESCATLRSQVAPCSQSRLACRAGRCSAVARTGGMVVRSEQTARARRSHREAPIHHPARFDNRTCSRGGYDSAGEGRRADQQHSITTRGQHTSAHDCRSSPQAAHTNPRGHDRQEKTSHQWAAGRRDSRVLRTQVVSVQRSPRQPRSERPRAFAARGRRGL